MCTTGTHVARPRPALLDRFPMIASVNWFEWDKHEVEVGRSVDYGGTRNEAFLYGGCGS